jgi:hypothetical protein
MDWFTREYTTVATAGPVLIHPRAEFDPQAAVPEGCRVVTTDKLTQLRDAVRSLSVGLADQDAFRDPARIGKLLTAHRLTAGEFLLAYSRPARPGALRSRAGGKCQHVVAQDRVQGSRDRGANRPPGGVGRELDLQRGK